MTPERDLKVVRRAYAKHVMAAAGSADPRLEAAFATVRREDFLAPGPWQILRWLVGYRPTPDDDPVHLYCDTLVAIDADEHVNNGQPSLHAKLISEALPEDGEHVVHIGAGVGYYTAILAELVGHTGRVTAIEYDAGRAETARKTLAHYPNVHVLCGDGSTADFDPADVIYVNAGATRPADIWLDRLNDRGRLILPLTTDMGFNMGSRVEVARQGAVFRVERRGSDFLAKWISPVAIFPCAGLRDRDSEAALAKALEQGGWDSVSRLRRDPDVPDDRCWLKAPGWCLTTA